MKHFHKILALCLALVLVLGLAACGEKKAVKKTDGADAEQIIDAAPGVLYIVADTEISLAYNEEGKALALSGNDTLGEKVAAACKDVEGKPASEAVCQILTAMQENNATLSKPYVIIRQAPNSAAPGNDFMDTIEASAQELLDTTPLIVISNADMDADGYCTQEIAKQILQAYLGGDAVIEACSTMIEGCYTIAATSNGTTTDFVVSAYSGSVALYEDLHTESLDEEDMIPESEQFDTTTDADEAADASDEDAA